MTVMTQNLVKEALTSPSLPVPDPLRAAGYTMFDLEMHYRRYISELSDKKLFCANPCEESNYTRKMHIAKRNFQHLAQRL